MTFLTIEGERERSLRAMPVCVRRKLAESGISLGEKQWAGLPMAARRRLVDMRVEGALERRSFYSLVLWLCGTFLASDGPPAPEVEHAPWRDSSPPDGVPLDAESWLALGLDARFALIEASKHGDVAALAAALTEGGDGRLLAPSDE